MEGKGGGGYLSSINRIRKEYLFCKNGIQKTKGLDLGAEPPHIKLCRVPPGIRFNSINDYLHHVLLIPKDSQQEINRTEPFKIIQILILLGGLLFCLLMEN